MLTNSSQIIDYLLSKFVYNFMNLSMLNRKTLSCILKLKQEYFSDNNDKEILNLIQNYFKQGNKTPLLQNKILEHNNNNSFNVYSDLDYKNFIENLIENNGDWTETSLNKYNLKSNFNNFLGYLENCESNKILTGINHYDNYFGGLTKGELVIIAAKPGGGKTSFGINLLVNQCRLNFINGKVVFFSLEMNKYSLYQRLFANLLNKNILDLQIAEIKDSLKTKLKLLKNTIILDTLSDNVSNILFISNYIKLVHSKISFVIIDYLQLITGGKFSDSYIAISYYLGVLRKLAMKYNIVIIVLNQIKREVYNSKNSNLGDMYGGSSVEQKSDLVIFLESVFLKNEESNNCSNDNNTNNSSKINDQNNIDNTKIILNILKNRNGPSGKIILNYISNYFKFY